MAEQFAIERWPGEGPTVVLLHAGVCDRRSWRDVAAQLARDGLDVVAYDRRGFGDTPRTDDEFTHLDDLFAVLDQAGEGPAWLVGSSMGGALAIDAALTAPDRVAGLVLISPAVSGAPEPDVGALDEGTRRIAAAIEEAEDTNDIDELNRHEVLLWLDGPAGPEGRVGGAARELAVDMNGIALYSGMPDGAGDSGIDAWSRLGELRPPVTLTWGDLDLPVILDRCREIGERLPAPPATHVFQGTAHLPYLERPGEVADVIRSAVGR